MQLNSSSPRTKRTRHFDAGQKLSFCPWTPSQSVSSGLRQTARAGVRAHLSLSCRSILWSLDWGFAVAFWTAAVLGVADPAQLHGFVPSDMNRSRRMKRHAYFPLLPSSLARLRSGWHWKWSRRNCFEAKPCIRKTSRSRYRKTKAEKVICWQRSDHRLCTVVVRAITHEYQLINDAIVGVAQYIYNILLWGSEFFCLMCHIVCEMHCGGGSCVCHSRVGTILAWEYILPELWVVCTFEREIIKVMMLQSN